MSKLKKQISFETTFGVYVVDELIGEGGAGRVYGGVGPDNAPIALKILKEEHVSADKKSRFKNELSFLAHNEHRNIVAVIDHGVTRGGKIDGPFYVMLRYPTSRWAFGSHRSVHIWPSASCDPFFAWLAMLSTATPDSASATVNPQ